MSEKKERDIEDRRNEISSERLILTRDALKALDNHKYKAGSYTPIDNFLNTYFWTPISEFLPMWMAPNLVTLLGFSFVLSGYALQVAYSSDFGDKEVGPWWVHLIAGVNMFIYQTMDAIDGKQARRTGNSSPLGQLFDHGIDAMSTTFLSFMTLTSLRVGYNIKTASGMFAVQLSFWFAQWGEYHTHTMNHSAGNLGVTEAQLCGIFSCLAAAAFGPTLFLLTPIPGLNVTVSDLCWFGDIAGGLYMSFAAIKSVVSSNTVDHRRAALQTVPIFVLVFTGCAWASLPQEHPHLVLGTCGIVFSYLTLWMILCAMTQMEYPWCPTIIYPLPLLFIVNYFQLLPEYADLLLGMYFSYAVYKTYKFVRCTIQEITSHLNINCLTIPYRPKEDKKPAPVESAKKK